MPGLLKPLAICLLASLLMALPAYAAPTSSEGPVATAARTCSVDGIWRKLGASYVMNLRTRRVSCPDARSFSRLYHCCRRRNGGRDGRCPRINRFRCTERRFNRIDISYDSNVRCVRGGQVISQTYTQLT